MTLDEFTMRAVSVPFEEHGRAWSGWDCYGLIMVAFEAVRGVKLPDVSGEYQSTLHRHQLNEIFERERSTHWLQVESPLPMDVAVLRLVGRLCHIGLILPRGRMVHAESRTNTVIEHYTRRPWQGGGVSLIQGFYRWPT